MVVFVCEDSPEGIFTGVYDAWNSRLGHENVRLEVQGEYNYSLFSEYREVAVDRLKAQKVVRSVRRSLSELAYSWIYRTALSEREDRAEAVYRFLVCGFSAGVAGRRITENLQIPAVQTVFQINRAVANEAHLQTEFMRFAEYSDQVLFSEIGPKNRVTALLMPYFTDRLPSEPFIIYDKNHQEEKEEKNEINDIIPNTKEKDDRKKLLVVEDNDEFRNYLTEQLSECYRVIDASNGEEAEKLILSEYPDLIISDLMMPKMDGIELCQRVKSNIQTSHTPFILLTARTSDESKMEGYEAGADSYISKPFSFELLCIRIKKLIEQQENRKMLFHKTIEITPSSITTTSLDEELVRKALHFVEENIDNPEYSIEDLSKDLGLSKTHLNRKLQSIVDLTPLQFIRSIRLKRAAQLLTNSQYNINEISYMVGFNTLKYFNSHFKEEFQMTPSQYREKNKG